MVECANAAEPTSGVDLRKVGAHPDHWYPVAWSHEVQAGKAFATGFAGEPIVLIRPRGGAIFALEDRCAHRQVPLSKGVVDGNVVRCCYHGWSYNAEGDCVDVPYLGKGKLPNGVQAYPCHETNGVVFVWPGSATPDAPPAKIGSVGDKAYKTRRFGEVVACHYTFMHENLMDMNHQFLHRSTTGKVFPRYLDRRVGDDWMEVDYSFMRPDTKPPLGESVIVGAMRGQSDKAQDLMTVRTEYPHQTLKFWTSEGSPVLDVWLGYTPVDKEQRFNRTFIALSVRRPKIPVVLDVVWPVLALFTNRVFREDREIVEMEQVAHDKQGSDWNQEVFPPIRDLRELLAANGQKIASPARSLEAE